MTLPTGWTFTDSTNTVATAPDGTTATGTVLSYVSDTTDALSSAQAQVSTLTAQVADLTGKLNAQDDDSGLASDVAALKTTAATLTADIDDLSSKVLVRQASDTDNKTAISALQAAVAALQGIDTAAAAAFTASAPTA